MVLVSAATVADDEHPDTERHHTMASKKKTVRKVAARKSTRTASRLEQLVSTLVGQALAANAVKTEPTSINYGKKKPAPAPAAAADAVTANVPTLTKWEREFLKRALPRLKKTGMLLPKQAGAMRLINAKLAARGEPQIEFAVATDGRANAPAAKKSDRALGRGMNDIELTAKVVAFLKGRTRGASLAALCGAVDGSKTGVAAILKRLATAGIVTVTGTGDRALYRAA